MKKQLILVPILTAIMLSGSLIANADNTSESINSTAQQSPDKRAGQPTSADTSAVSSSTDDSPSEATIDSSTSHSNNGGGQTDNNSSKSSVVQHHHSGGGTTSGGGSGSTWTPSYGYSNGYSNGNYNSSKKSEHTVSPTETKRDRVLNARDHITDAQRRQKTRKAKIAVAQATLKYKAAKKQYHHSDSDQNKAKLEAANKNLKRAHDALLKILI